MTIRKYLVLGASLFALLIPTAAVAQTTTIVPAPALGHGLGPGHQVEKRKCFGKSTITNSPTDCIELSIYYERQVENRKKLRINDMFTVAVDAGNFDTPDCGRIHSVKVKQLRFNKIIHRSVGGNVSNPPCQKSHWQGNPLRVNGRCARVTVVASWYKSWSPGVYDHKKISKRVCLRPGR